jgi:hypothetical protein
MSRRRTVVCTVATGPHEELYEISGPTFERFADHHGYDLIVAHHDLSADRPPSWSKVPLVRELLESYDRVVWIDADAIIVDPTGDILEATGFLRPLRVAVHRYDGLEIPNLGVIAMASTGWTKRFFDRLWSMDRYAQHRWWENAAALDALGYDVEDPRGDTRRPSVASRRVGELDRSWNSISLDPSARPRIVHFAGMSHADRLIEMRQTADLAAAGVEAPGGARRRAIVDDDIGRRGLTRLLQMASS